MGDPFGLRLFRMNHRHMLIVLFPNQQKKVELGFALMPYFTVKRKIGEVRAMWRIEVAAIGLAMAVLCSPSKGEATTGDWLITPEEAAMAPPSDPPRGIIGVGREDISTGPVIEVVEPLNGGRGPMPIQVLIRFTPRAEPVDLSSLRVTLVKFIQIDITDRIKPFVTLEGIDVKEAKIPPGKHRVRISVSDKAGGVSVKEVSFEVL